MGPCVSYNFKRCFSHSSCPISTIIVIRYIIIRYYKYVSHGEVHTYYKLFLAICQKLNILWHFGIFVNTGSYGARNFKMLLLQLSSDLSQTL